MSIVKELRDQDEVRSLILSYGNLSPTGQKMVAAAKGEKRLSTTASFNRMVKRDRQIERLGRICG